MRQEDPFRALLVGKGSTREGKDPAGESSPPIDLPVTVLQRASPDLGLVGISWTLQRDVALCTSPVGNVT
jgi:hypothetical protein